MVKEANLFIKLYNYYESQLIPKNKIDLDDMIYYANKYMTNVNSTQNLLNYDYKKLYDFSANDHESFSS